MTVYYYYYYYHHHHYYHNQIFRAYETCFDPHLGHLQSNVLKTINPNCMLNLCFYVDILRSQSVHKTKHFAYQNYSVKVIIIRGNSI